MSTPRIALVAGILVAAVAVTVLVAVAGLRGGRDFQSNGERIYFTALNDRGDRISYRGGPDAPPMHRLSCASCHRGNGAGGAAWIMMRRVDAPDIRWSTLSEGLTEGSGGDHGHLPYTREALARAIVDGVNPDGEPLASTMPRWQLSPRDLDDLLDYLETLGATDGER